jgi:membrane protein required for colicin V production
VSLAVFLLALSIREAIARIKLQEYDRHLGLLLGGIKGVLLCLVITFFAVAMSPAARDHILQTHSGYAAALVMSHLDPIMPPALHEKLHPYIHALDETLPAGARPHADDHTTAVAGTAPPVAANEAATAKPKEPSAAKLLGPVLRLADKLSDGDRQSR